MKRRLGEENIAHTLGSLRSPSAPPPQPRVVLCHVFVLAHGCFLDAYIQQTMSSHPGPGIWFGIVPTSLVLLIPQCPKPYKALLPGNLCLSSPSPEPSEGLNERGPVNIGHTWAVNIWLGRLFSPGDLGCPVLLSPLSCKS